MINCQSKVESSKDKFDEAAAIGQIEESTFRNYCTPTTLGNGRDEVSSAAEGSITCFAFSSVV